MFRPLLRSITINFAGVYVAFRILDGVITYVGGIHTLLTAAIIIALVNLFVRPVINLLLLPLNLVTLGMFRWLANLVTLFLVIRFIPNIQIQAFVYSGLQTPFLIIPRLEVSAFGAYLLATLTLAVVFHFIYWLLQD